MLELEVEEGETKIVAASIYDLNAIYTPFTQISLAKNIDEQFTIQDNVIYFQPTKMTPFSLYITQKGDPNAPTYKITVGPSEVPVGQQIRLVPKKPYVPKQNQQRAQKHHDYPSTIIGMLSDTARMMADSRLHQGPMGFVLDTEFESQPFYFGNALISPDKKLISSNYEIYILALVNRSNDPMELVHADFSEISPATGLTDAESPFNVAGVGFFPIRYIEPGQSTSVIVVRSL